MKKQQSFSSEKGVEAIQDLVDDDGKPKRTGTSNATISFYFCT